MKKNFALHVNQKDLTKGKNALAKLEAPWQSSLVLQFLLLPKGKLKDCDSLIGLKDDPGRSLVVKTMRHL
jgi:hypothetical protein